MRRFPPLDSRLPKPLCRLSLFVIEFDHGDENGNKFDANDRQGYGVSGTEEYGEGCVCVFVN